MRHRGEGGEEEEGGAGGDCLLGLVGGVVICGVAAEALGKEQGQQLLLTENIEKGFVEIGTKISSETIGGTMGYWASTFLDEEGGC